MFKLCSTLTYFPPQQLLFWASDNTLSMNGWRSLNNNTHTHNTLLRSCLYTHSHPRTRLERWMSKLGSRTTYFQTHSQSLSTTLNFYHLNYPSCKIPSHTFHLSPLLACTVPPSLCSKATILSCSRSHRSLASAQSLEQGHNLADKDCGMFGSVFPGLCTQND